VAGTLVVLVAIIAGVFGTLAFAASLDRLVTDRSRFGSNYTFGVGENSDLDAEQLRTALDDDPDISGLMILSASEARAGRETVELVGVELVRGALRPHVLSGRQPAAPDEVALGRVNARHLRVGVGDELQLTGEGTRSTFRVVGIVVVPTVGGNDGVGRGSIVTSDGLSRLGVEPTTIMAAVELRDGASGSDARQRIGELVGAPLGTQDVPSSILNVARVRRIPMFLAALLGGLGLVTLVHALIVSIQNRRRDLAVLRALGADRRWLSRLVHWQASILTSLPLLPGVPLGLVAGAVVFRAFTDRIGALPDPVFPFIVIAALALGLVVVANIAAVIPARRARRVSPARLLRDE
jgi:putative ABC transport system permease protein